MPNPEIIRYITAARAQGIHDETIKAQLIAAGWPPLEVTQALNPQASIPPVQMPPVQTPQAGYPQNFPPRQPTMAGFAPPGPTMPSQMMPVSQEGKPGKPIKLIILIITAIVVLVGGGFLAFNLLGKKSVGGKATSKEASKTVQTKTGGESKSEVAKVIFDVPSLLGKTRQEIKAKLGKTMTEDTGFVTFNKEEYYLSAFYDLDSGAFRYINVSIPQDTGKIKDQKTIFKALSLVDGSNQYIVKLDRNSSNQEMIINVRVYPPGSKDYSLED